MQLNHMLFQQLLLFNSFMTSRREHRWIQNTKAQPKEKKNPRNLMVMVHTHTHTHTHTHGLIFINVHCMHYGFNEQQPDLIASVIKHYSDKK